MNIPERLKEMAAELKAMFPTVPSVHLCADHTGVHVDCHQCPDNAHGTAILRGLGVGVREKSVFSDNPPWHALKGFASGVEFKVFCGGLPPSCRLEKVTEKIPKQQTVDTGEYIEVERTKVICGDRPEREGMDL